MRFSSLFTNSLREDNPTYLERLDPGLLDETESKARAWALEHYKKYGRMPSRKMLENHDEFRIFLDLTYKDDAIAAVFDGALDYLIGRYMIRVNAEAREQFDRTGVFPIEMLNAATNYVSGISRIERESIFSIDRDAMYSGRSLARGVQFGIKTIDKMSGGILPQEFAVFAARTGIGKSLFCCWLAVLWARAGKRVFCVSSEMPNAAMTQRIDGILAGFNPRLFRDPTATPILAQYRSIVQQELDLIRADGGDIIFPKNRVITLQGLISEIKDNKPDIAIVDGIYLIRSSTNSSLAGWEKVKVVSNELKQTAMDMDMPIFATTQLKRTGGKTDGYDLEDIAYSDAIGQDADLVMTASREEGVPTHRIAIEIIKNRHGESFGGVEVDLRWDTMRIEEVPFTQTTIVLGGNHGTAAAAI